MGGSTYSNDDYKARSTVRSATAKASGISVKAATFAHTAAVSAGRARGTHPSLSPKFLNARKEHIRECRDSDAHPIAVPVAVFLDCTGSMSEVPGMIQANLPKLMGAFLDDKASGKKYLGDGYPAILVGGVDDYFAQRSCTSDDNDDDNTVCSDGTLQVSQFESGLEIDDHITNLWITNNGGGGEPRESYQLAMYFMAHHSVHDHMEKRGKKGYMFIIGDEHCYQETSKQEIKDVIGDKVQSSLHLKDIVAAVQEKYHVIFILPNLTSHYKDKDMPGYWTDLLGQGCFIKLADPNKICETIVGVVATLEGGANADDVKRDLGVDTKALATLASTNASVVKAGLTSGKATKRL